MQNKYSFKEKQRRNHKFIKDLRNNKTPAEKTLEKKLDAINLDYISQKGFIQGKNHVIVDIYIPHPYKVCIEVDGKYHQEPRQKRRDRAKETYLESRGFNILRISNETAERLSHQELLRKLKELAVCKRSPKI